MRRLALLRRYMLRPVVKTSQQFFVNNAIYGMTGGQMAPTSLPDMVTQTSPYGRDVKVAGYPVRVCEMISTLSGTAYAERVAVDSVKNINAAKKAIKKSLYHAAGKAGLLDC